MIERDRLFDLIRGFGYTTSGQTGEIVNAILAAAKPVNASEASERTAFETWWKRDVPQGYHDLTCVRDGDGKYAVENCQQAWEGWQARAAAKPVSADARTAVIEECCTAIKAADDESMKEDVMLDSDQCIQVLRGLLTPPTESTGEPK